jgi:hypothetical protein
MLGQMLLTNARPAFSFSKTKQRNASMVFLTDMGITSSGAVSPNTFGIK